VGATYMKHVRMGDPGAVSTFLLEWLRCISWARLLMLRPRAGLGCFLGYGMGAVLSFRYPLDSRKQVYVTPRARRAGKTALSRQPAPRIPLSTAVAQDRSSHGQWRDLPRHVPHPRALAGIRVLTTLLLLLLLPVSCVSRSVLANGHSTRCTAPHKPPTIVAIMSASRPKFAPITFPCAASACPSRKSASATGIVSRGYATISRQG
jgi:hypothetical protein